MKIFVTLLAFGLFGISVSEKLFRGYLPPPGAKHAGGEPRDLQIPFHYPKKTPIFRSGFNNVGEAPEFTNGMIKINDNSLKINEQSNKLPIYKSGLENNIYRPGYKNGLTRTNYNDGIPGVEDELPTVTESPHKYIETYVLSGSATTIPPLGLQMATDAEKNDMSLSYRYPMNGNQLIQKQGQYMKPGSVIATSNDIIKHYQPNVFGMYGGSPMIVKTLTDLLTDLPPVNHLRSNVLVPLKSELAPMSLKPNKIKSVMSKSDMIPTQQNIVQQNHYIKLERIRGELDRNADILSYENMQSPEKYAYNFETSNGIKMDESAITMDGTKAQGSYSYIGDDGKVYNLNYVADENGFQPIGDHLPTPPPIPEAIQRVIEQAFRDKEAGIIHDGSYDEEKYGHLKYERPVSRYLQNLKKITALKNGNGVKDSKQNMRPASNGQAEGDIFSERKLTPVNNLEGRFGMKRVLNGERGGLIDHDNIQKMNYYQKPKFLAENRETNLKLLSEPNEIKYVTQRPGDIKNKQISLPDSDFDDIGQNFNNNGLNNNITENILKSAILNKKSNKVIESDNSGYYYVPPSSLFIEGRQQSKQKPINHYNAIKEDNNISVNPVQEYNDYNENKIFNRFSTKPVQNTEEYFTTEGPVYQQTSQIDYLADDTNLNSDLSITDKQNYFTYVPMQNIDTVPVAYFNKNNADTDFSIRDNTEILGPNNRNENAVPSIRNDIAINIYQSTTPLPPQSNTIQILRSNQYETTNAPVDVDDALIEKQANEGYLITTPDVPANFEEITSSFKPTFTGQDVQSNIQVDGFGRPIEEVPVKYQNDLDKFTQDINSPKKYDNQPKSDEYFTTEVPTNKKVENGGVYPTDKTTNYYGQPNTSTNAEPSSLKFSENSSSEPQGTTQRDSGDKTILPEDIGEDFSGPKQPQKFDPETGYYY